MGLDKYGDKAVEKLRKTGKATLVFTVEVYHGDENLASDPPPPSIDLYIIPRNNKETSPPKDLPVEFNKGIITENTDKPERMFEMQVETITGFFSRAWYNLTKSGKNINGGASKKKRAEPMEVWIVAEPHGKCADFYQRTYIQKN